MNANDPIEIRQVGNGYYVMPAFGPGDQGRLVSDNNHYAFSTFAELAEWLGNHFTYRKSVPCLNDETAP